MPRTSSRTTTNGRRARRSARGADTREVVRQITQLVAANESLQRENRELSETNARLCAELMEIGSALGRITGPSRGRGRRGAAAPTPVTEVQPRRQRKPITDPDQLERRRAALAKARAARSEKLAAAREAAAVSQ